MGAAIAPVVCGSVGSQQRTGAKHEFSEEGFPTHLKRIRILQTPNGFERVRDMHVPARRVSFFDSSEEIVGQFRLGKLAK